MIFPRIQFQLYTALRTQALLNTLFPHFLALYAIRLLDNVERIVWYRDIAMHNLPYLTKREL